MFEPTVLVVDDEPEVLAVVTAMIAHLGYQPVPAASGAEALARIREHDPSAVVMDVRMPEMDGPAALNALRDQSPGLPCVFVSGDPRPYTIPELLSPGGAVFVPKPLGLTRLREALAEMLSAPADHLGPSGLAE